jgi:hypothetical protein
MKEEEIVLYAEETDQVQEKKADTSDKNSKEEALTQEFDEKNGRPDLARPAEK